MSDQSAAINNNAQGPASAEQDGTKVTAHSIADQIAADRYAATRTAQSNKRTGLRLFKVIPPGSV